jgi:hypothetical protein
MIEMPAAAATSKRKSNIRDLRISPTLSMRQNGNRPGKRAGRRQTGQPSLK